MRGVPRPERTVGRVRTLAFGVAIFAVAACGTPLPLIDQVVTAPNDWQTVAVLDANKAVTASVAFPPSFHPNDNPPAGLDNRADAITQEGLTVQFEGPRNPDSQLLPGEDLRAILQRRLELGGEGVATYADVVLGAGPAVRMDRVDQRGVFTYRVVCYAIQMRDGTAFLMFDGAPDTYAGHELEISQIAAFVASS